MLEQEKEKKNITAEQAAEILKKKNFSPSAYDLDRLKEIMLKDQGATYFSPGEDSLHAHFKETEVELQDHNHRPVITLDYDQISAIGQLTSSHIFVSYEKGIKWTMTVESPTLSAMQPYFDWLDL